MTQTQVAALAALSGTKWNSASDIGVSAATLKSLVALRFVRSHTPMGTARRAEPAQYRRTGSGMHALRVARS